MRTAHDPKRGFTLTELLVVIAIIGCLVSLLMPSITAVRQKADSLKCVSNLRAIGEAVLLYANDHQQREPIIEPWPSQPVYAASDGAQSMLDALSPYGISNSVLQCPSDLKGPNYFKKEGSSYQWFPGASGQNTQSIKPVFFRRANQTMTLSELFLAFDYSAVHNGNSNVLYGDGHVATND
jgi:prepilin-type N-terminal cleavage/methylation domain-containing protein/prepilin-type processing-associated H-X9-DG protein